jgi:hypothetical protein
VGPRSRSRLRPASSPSRTCRDGGGFVLVVGGHVDLHGGPEVDTRCRNVARRELSVQGHHDHGRPCAVEFLPRGDVIERRAKMVAQRHGMVLHMEIVSAVPARCHPDAPLCPPSALGPTAGRPGRRPEDPSPTNQPVRSGPSSICSAGNRDAAGCSSSGGKSVGEQVRSSHDRKKPVECELDGPVMPLRDHFRPPLDLITS